MFSWRTTGSSGLLAVLSSCVDVGTFACLESAQCDRSTSSVCIQGACAVPDPSCQSGHRFDADARFAGQCVPIGGGDGSTTTRPSLEATGTGSRPTSGEPPPSSDSASGDPDCPGGSCECAVGVGLGLEFGCMVRESGRVACWGRNDMGQVGRDDATTPIAPLHEVDLGGALAVEVAGDLEHACARLAEGGVWCWGHNVAGAVDPEGSFDEILAPRPVAGVEGAVALRVGHRSGCVRHADDRLTCWGSNGSRELLSAAEGPAAQTSGPWFPGELVDVELGHGFGCMWTDAEVHCWGGNNAGQLGSGRRGPATEIPQRVPLTSAPLDVGLGRYHACAVVDDGAAVVCWGNDVNEQSGGGPVDAVETPTALDVEWPGGIMELVVHYNTSCAWLDSAQLWCWGGVRAGSLGVADAMDLQVFWPPARLEPFAEIPAPVAQLGVGDRHACARTSEGRVLCWGDDTHAQLGPSLPSPGMDVVALPGCGDG